MASKRRKIAIVLLILVTSASFTCKKSSEVKGVDFEVSFSESPLSDRLITDVQYRWITKRNFAGIEKDYLVFVHFWHRNNLILHDNHAPEIPTSQWKPEKEYTYSRRIYIPPFIDASDPEFRGVETLKLSVGIAFSGEKKPLRKVFEEKLELIPPPPDTPEITYENGWYDFEMNPESFLKRWRWTAKEAKCIIDNPHQDALLVINGGVESKVFREQKVIFRLNGTILDEFIPKKSHFEKSYKIKKEMLGGGERFHLIISTNKTFIPAQVIPGSKDKRELGIKISFIYFR